MAQKDLVIKAKRFEKRTRYDKIKSAGRWEITSPFIIYRGLRVQNKPGSLKKWKNQGACIHKHAKCVQKYSYLMHHNYLLLCPI